MVVFGTGHCQAGQAAVRLWRSRAQATALPVPSQPVEEELGGRRKAFEVMVAALALRTNVLDHHRAHGRSSGREAFQRHRDLGATVSTATTPSLECLILEFGSP